MQETECRDQYPAATVFIANFVSVLTWGIGAVILYQFGLIWLIAYILYILLLEFRLLGGHCVDCYYYGRTCAFGRGRLSSVLFPRGDPEKFSRMKVTWKDIVPDFLVFFVPAIAGIILLVMHFSAPVLVLVILLLVLGFLGNAFVRGQLACRFCRQRKNGCPAERLFDKDRK